MMEVLIENKGDGKIYEISEIITSISYSDKLNNGCSKLDFSYLNDGIVFTNGSVVRFKYDGENVFYGFIFRYEGSQEDEISAVAYDQTRYLKAKDSMIIKDQRVDELIRKIANQFILQVGKLDDTGYKLPIAVKDNQTYLDMIYDGISTTLIGSGRKYAFYDSFGSLDLTDLNNLRLPLVIGDESLVYGYNYSQSIDENTYNLIKLAKDNEKTGKREIYIAQDSSSFSKYGILQYFEKVDKDANEAQIKAKADALLKLMNAETRSMSIDAIGETRVKAGTSVIARFSDLGINQYLIVESSKHSYKNNVHTMSLELIL